MQTNDDEYTVKCIDIYLTENRLESQFLNCIEMDQIERLIRHIREHDDYKTLIAWPLPEDGLPGGFKTLCENALFAHGNLHKLCFRALTLYVFTNDICHYRIKDNDVKNELLKIAKEIIIFYDVDWTLILQKQNIKRYRVRHMCAKVLLLTFAAYVLYICVK